MRFRSCKSLLKVDELLWRMPKVWIGPLKSAQGSLGEESRRCGVRSSLVALREPYEGCHSMSVMQNSNALGLELRSVERYCTSSFDTKAQRMC